MANQFARYGVQKKTDDSVKLSPLPDKFVYTFIQIGEHDHEDVGRYTMFPSTDI